MSRPRRGLTIGSVLFVIAFFASLLAMERYFAGFGLLIALFSPIAILGFVFHRLRGGDGLLGAILGGGIGCAVFGISIALIDAFFGQGPGPDGLEGLRSYYPVYLAVFGAGLGYAIGLLLFSIFGPGPAMVRLERQTDGAMKAMVGYGRPDAPHEESA